MSDDPQMGSGSTNAPDHRAPDHRAPDHDAAGTDVPEGPTEFICPRCRLTVTEEYYGPCQSCRTTLRATLGGDGREVADASYEPKMNVTPNAVATKD
ncbi:MAG: hypothetical protein WBA45_13045 [Microthrixaceae bacterium]